MNINKNRRRAIERIEESDLEKTPTIIFIKVMKLGSLAVLKTLKTLNVLIILN